MKESCKLQLKMKESCKLQLERFKGLEKPPLICCIKFQANRLKCHQNKIEQLNIISRFQMVTTPKRMCELGTAVGPLTRGNDPKLNAVIIVK